MLLLERGHLASGATRRSQGLLLEPEVDPMQPLFAESNRLYDHLAERAGIELALDREPIGTLFLATSEAQLERLARNVPAEGTDARPRRACSRPSRAWLRPCRAGC